MLRFHNRILLPTVLLLIVTSMAHADENGPILPTHTFGVSEEIGYFDYEEDGLMEETGWMTGILGNYTLHHRSGLMASASLRFVYGELDYDGRYSDGRPLKTDTEDYIIELRGLLGYDFIVGHKHVITPYFGLAHRYWNDEIQATGGYEREIAYFYAPIGVTMVSPLAPNWKWGWTAEFDLFLKGKVKSHLSDVTAAYNDPENDQDFGDGFGLRCSVMVERNISDIVAISVEPYLRYWDVEDSDTAILYRYGVPYARVYEPENETMAYGLNINFRF